MPAIVILGAQWGDEARARPPTCSPRPRPSTTSCARRGARRFGTIVIDGEKFATHLLPSGISYKGCTSVIGNGVVVSPEALFREVDMTAEASRSSGSSCRRTPT